MFGNKGEKDFKTQQNMAWLRFMFKLQCAEPAGLLTKKKGF